MPTPSHFLTYLVFVRVSLIVREKEFPLIWMKMSERIHLWMKEFLISFFVFFHHIFGVKYEMRSDKQQKWNEYDKLSLITVLNNDGPGYTCDSTVTGIKGNYRSVMLS